MDLRCSRYFMWTETYSEPYHIYYEMELITEIVNGFQLLNILAKSFTLDMWQGSEYNYCGE